MSSSIVIISTPGALAPHIPTSAPEANGTRSGESTATETEGETTHDELPTYTAGTTPMDVILAQFDKQSGTNAFEYHRRYPCVLKGEDAQAMRRVVAQGVDSHLEAFTSSTFEDLRGHALACRISRADFPVLIRRLREMADEGDDAAEHLVGAILESLGIEEV